MDTVTQVRERLTPRSIEELEEYVGRELGASEWRLVTQEDVDAFAEVTGDRQWIHIDPVRAATGPFGGPIAHGYYTLSLAPALLAELIGFERFAAAINYGLDKLRFPAPLRVGDSVRMRAAIAGIEEFPGGATLRVELTFERSGAGKPVCVASALYRVLTGADR
jgi:acyl dehydratase